MPSSEEEYDSYDSESQEYDSVEDEDQLTRKIFGQSSIDRER